jgi:hypothetical protein
MRRSRTEFSASDKSERSSADVPRPFTRGYGAQAWLPFSGFPCQRPLATLFDWAATLIEPDPYTFSISPSTGTVSLGGFKDAITPAATAHSTASLRSGAITAATIAGVIPAAQMNAYGRDEHLCVM